MSTEQIITILTNANFRTWPTKGTGHVRTNATLAQARALGLTPSHNTSFAKGAINEFSTLIRKGN